MRLAEGYRVICTSCQEAVIAAREVARRDEGRVRVDRERLLAAMPYGDGELA